jgi:hypothetical protein
MDEADLVSIERRLVVDSRSQLTTVEFATSIWAKRKVAIKVGTVGGLSSYEYAADSTAGAVGKTLSELPANVASGLEQAAKLREDVSKLRDASAEEALTATERQLKQKQADLDLAGLTATETDYAELEGLKQQKELLQTGTAVSTAAVTEAQAAQIAALKQQLDLAKTQQALDNLK